MSFADIIIIHSRISEDLIVGVHTSYKHKVKYIPHPSYIGVYTKCGVYFIKRS
jgi:hypothetical protein